MVSKQDRLDWVYDFVKENMVVDILDAYFVDCYIEKFPNLRHHYTPYGANKCPQAAKDLKELYEQGLLKRHRTGLPYDMRGLGLPLWVWSYTIRYKV